MPQPAPPRRHDLDWIRIAAFGLLILYHVGMYYVSWDWHVKSPFAATTIEPLMRLSSPWRLALLFLVSGAATAFLLARGTQGFVGSRSRRLLIPLAFGMLVVVVPQAYYEVVEKHAYAEGWLAFYTRYLTGYDQFCALTNCLILPTWNHLWFVAYLWVYSVLLWAALKWLPGPLAALESRVARACSGIGVLLWPAALLVAIRLALVGHFPSTHALVDDWYNHALFGSVFLLGFLIARHDPVWDALRRHRWTALGLAAVAYAVIAWYFGSHSATQPAPDAVRLLQRVFYGLDQWAAIAAVLGFARQLAPGDGPARRYLTQAVFPFYIVHQTAIVVLAHHLKPLALTPAVEGPLLIVATFAVCFASFELIRRVGWLRPLFGLPHRDRATASAAAPQAA
jgi:glucan biosynthesis protein C